jgi:hypothetical protein
VILGDARLTLADVPDGSFDLLVLDAFTSDAIPMHLLTLQAMNMYKRKLAPDGILTINISNRYLKLNPVVARLAKELGWLSWSQKVEVTAKEDQEGKSTSIWMLLGAPSARLDAVAGKGRWDITKPESKTPLWTDDFSNLLSVVDWEEVMR